MNKELIRALDELEESKGISKEQILDALEKAMVKSYEKNFNDQTNVEVHIDSETGDMKMYSLREVVKEVEDPLNQISLEEARLKRKRIDLGDVLKVEVKPKNFGRVAAQTARNIVIQRIHDAERETVYQEYIDRVKEMITGTVQRIDFHNVYINLGKTEGVIPPNEQIPNEHLEVGQRVKLYVEDVRNSSKGPQILVSRAHHNLVVRLFEQEVPEIADGVVEIYSVAREAGSRTKIAVYSTDPNVDPIGACVGYKGTRVNIIVDELNGEKMDIIIYNEDPKVFISNALSPAQVIKVLANPNEKTAVVVVADDQLSLAIGKEGQNVRLAARLTGWKIDIKGESQYLEDPEKYDQMEQELQESEETDEVETSENDFEEAEEESVDVEEKNPADLDATESMEEEATAEQEESSEPLESQNSDHEED